MPGYYLYHFHPNGRFAGRDEFGAEDDAEATCLAARTSHGDAMELWRGPVKVKTFPAKPRLEG